MKTSSLQARVPTPLKKAAENILKRMGLDTSTAIRIYFNKIVQIKKIPFEITASLEQNAIPEDTDEKIFWQHICEKSLQDVWDTSEDAVWDTITKDLPSIKNI